MSFLESARSVFLLEIEQLQNCMSSLSVSFDEAIDIIADSVGRVVIIGMGKSGIIGQKIAATMASTGTTTFFVHPGEAYHGDLGMIHCDDVVLMISNSGETEELIRLLPFIQYQKNKVIALVGNSSSTLAKHSDVVLDVSVEKEACENNLAPTSSTTTALVMGDALALTLSKIKNFSPEDFARFHPGGSLGKKLLSRVLDVMYSGNLPMCLPTSSFKDVVTTITEWRLGVVLVHDDRGEMLGIITDGDLRRVLESENQPQLLQAKDILTETPYIINANERLVVAEKMMFDLKKRLLVVVDNNKKIVGIIQIFDL